MPSPSAPDAPVVPFSEAARAWAEVALLSFGGPAGQIAVMHRVVVEERRWVGEGRFLHALSYCMLLPGPEAQQLATYLGWLLHGTRGGLLAGGLFVLPGFLSILLLSVLYAGFQEHPALGALFFGLKAAVVAVVIEALVRIGRRVVVHPARIALSLLAFVAIFFWSLPFPLIVATAAAIGLVGSRLAPAWFLALAAPAAAPDAEAHLDRLLDARAATRPPVGRTLAVAGTWLSLWLLPLLALVLLLGPDHVLAQVGAFFSQAAVVTFGGAYAVLAYVAQQAVEHHGWLRPGEMLDGLGMAETTPGPLIQVVQFVGFMAAYRDPGTLHPMLAGLCGALVTTWVTFAPCFLWIFTGAPYIEWLRGNRALSAALAAITAAVVGVIANLAAWFGLHVVFADVQEQAGPLGLRLLVPTWSTVDPAALALCLGATAAMLRWKVGMVPTLATCALLGLGWRLLAT